MPAASPARGILMHVCDVYMCGTVTCRRRCRDRRTCDSAVVGLVYCGGYFGARAQYGAVLALLAPHGVAVTCHVVVCVCT